MPTETTETLDKENAEQQEEGQQQEEQQEERTEEQEDADDAAMMAGFNQARGDEPPAEAPATETAQASETDPTEATADAPTLGDEPDEEQRQDSGAAPKPGEAAQQLLAGLTEEQVKDLFDKVPNLEARLAAFDQEIRKVHGKFGEINSKLQKAGVPKIGKLSRLSEEFPEIAEMLVADLTDILSGGAGGLTAEETAAAQAAAAEAGGGKEAITEEMVQARIAAEVGKVERKLLSLTHPDWQDIAKSPEFVKLAPNPKDPNGEPIIVGGWLATLSPEDQQKYRYSEDAVVAAEAFTKFKTFQKSRKQSSTRRQERLERGITPKGEGATPVTQDDDAALEFGFRSVRGKR